MIIIGTPKTSELDDYYIADGDLALGFIKPGLFLVTKMKIVYISRLTTNC